ncbi:MAG: 30S ribosomal protein S8e [Candidatus Diapherotrites archaeon]|nr:30S ribosomal protein S8e [Candidatus Diapherotrites archaeon]
MTEWHMKSGKKPTGGRSRTLRRCNKKLAWKGGIFASTKVNAVKQVSFTAEGLGGTSKLKLNEAKFANVLDPKTKKSQKFDIANVVENSANREYARRNILTKGAIIEVKKGSETVKARVTSRPGQSGVINAVLLN